MDTPEVARILWRRLLDEGRGCLQVRELRVMLESPKGEREEERWTKAVRLIGEEGRIKEGGSETSVLIRPQRKDRDKGEEEEEKLRGNFLIQCVRVFACMCHRV